jgi:hypothetical protein
MNCCWKWIRGDNTSSDSDITKDLLENEEPASSKEEPASSKEEQASRSSKEVHFAVVEESPIDRVVEEDGTGSNSETETDVDSEIDYDDDIFEDADSECEQLPVQQELSAAEVLPVREEKTDSSDMENSVNSSNAETIVGFIM